MDSFIKQYTYADGAIQKVHLVRPDRWEDLSFFQPPEADNTLTCFSDIYRNFLVPACPWLFGNMVMFRLPEDVEIPFSFSTKKYGRVADPLTAAAVAMEQTIRLHRGKPHFATEEARAFWQTLESRDCIRIVCGKLPVTSFVPLGTAPGYLTQAEPDAQMKVNASFFIMDKFDCATVYDHIGTTLGLCVKDGVVLNPPLYHREALLVSKDGSVRIKPADIHDMDIRIGGTTYHHGRNCRIYTRPNHPFVIHPGETKIVIVGRRVAAVSSSLSIPVPASGFVLSVKGPCSVTAGSSVEYLGMEEIAFGIQVGNSILINGEKTMTFRSRFYNIRHLEPVPYPPSLYPMDFDNARAARIALGSDSAGRPMLLWAEGAAKFGYVHGKGSCGASLKEMAHICADVGMVNAVNLDGGGSAQILLNNRRTLKISDRNKQTHAEAERPVPLGLMIK
ncbi:MAG: phosphodiester glycosidase family protein [Oscillospiraceae bacterium]|nr:phosphodiester glycosidase family protein [Oscillospiraceae bacterium]